MVARSPDGGAAPSDDLETGVAEPRGRECTTSHRMPAAEEGGRPSTRNLYPPQDKRRRRGAGPRAWEVLCEGNGDTPPQGKREEAGGDNGPGDSSSVAHGGGVATRTDALDQPETGCCGYTRRSARHRECSEDASLESQRAYSATAGARAPAEDEDQRPEAGRAQVRMPQTQQRSAKDGCTDGRKRCSGYAVRRRPESTDEDEDGAKASRQIGGGERGHSSRTADCNGSTSEDGHGDKRRRLSGALVISEVGSLRRSLKRPPQAARAALLCTLARPDKRARNDEGGLEEQVSVAGCGDSPRGDGQRIETDQEAVGGGPGATCEFGVAAARRRLTGKQPPPRAGVG